jgi:glycosyltransferase involved in cell wall biosynthesis
VNPKASFVIPAYNAEAFLRETLDSCLDQTEDEIEVLVINDGSTDGTRELLQHYAKKGSSALKPSTWRKNVGRSEARNIGNAAAKGDYILVLDADDKAVRDRTKRTLECFSRSKLTLVYGGYVTIDTFSHDESILCRSLSAGKSRIKHKTHFILHSTLAYRKGVTLNVQYQKEPYDKLGIDDWRFIWDCALKGYKFAYVKQPLAYYRVVDDTVSHTRDEKEVLRVKDEFLKRSNRPFRIAMIPTDTSGVNYYRMAAGPKRCGNTGTSKWRCTDSSTTQTNAIAWQTEIFMCRTFGTD